MLAPFINVRWWDIIYPDESIDVAIQNWIQDIYNEYNWSWLYTSTSKKKEDFIDGNWYYLVELPVNKSIWSVHSFDDDWNWLWELEEIKQLVDLRDNNFLKHWNYIITTKPINATISYFKDFEWTLFEYDAALEIPMPNKMIPALYYLVLSQIDIIEVTQATNETYDNYNKYANKIETLKSTDPIIATSIAWGNRH